MAKINNNFYKSKKYKNIREVLKFAIDNYSDSIAFTIKNKIDNKISYTDITYREFGNQIRYFGTGMINIDLKDKKIAIIGPNTYEWVLAYSSILSIGGVVVPLDKGLPTQEIEDSIIRSRI